MGVCPMSFCVDCRVVLWREARAQVYPGAIPETVIWEAGHLSSVEVGGLPGVASSGGERLNVEWFYLVRSPRREV